MSAAKNRLELLTVTKNEFAKLTRILETVSETNAIRSIDGAETILDTVLHRAHWIHLFLGWVEDGRAGKPVSTPAEGYKWNQLTAYNAAVRQHYAGVGWIEARERLQDAHTALMAFIRGETDDTLYVPHLYPWMNDWTIGRWAEASGGSHYRSASKYIRSVLRTLSS